MTACAKRSRIPVLAAPRGPRLGRQFQAKISGLLTNMPIAAIVVGFSDTSFHGIPLPARPASLGLPFFLQGASLDPGIKAIGAVRTNAGRCVIGL